MVEKDETQSKKRKAEDLETDMLSKKKKYQDLLEELAPKLVLLNKLLPKENWEGKAKNLGALVGLELNFEDKHREDAICILAEAHIN